MNTAFNKTLSYVGAFGTIKIVYHAPAPKLSTISYTDMDQEIDIKSLTPDKLTDSYYTARLSKPNKKFKNFYNWQGQAATRTGAIADLYKQIGQRLAYNECDIADIF